MADKKKNELTDMKITHVSYVNKAANKKQFFLMKSENETPAFEKEVPIFINKADEEKKLVYGVVYEPDAVDTQGDFAKSEVIEKAAHEFLADARNIDLQHNFEAGYGTLQESYIAPVDFKIGEQQIKKGSWVIVTKATDEVWESIKKGEITGYSMGGKATRSEAKETNKVNKEASDPSTSDEVKGFFNVMKSFFIGKADKTESAARTSKSFAERMAVADVMENMWRVTDALTSTMRDILADKAIGNKQDELTKSIDEFATYMKKRVSKVDEGITKADTDFFDSENIEKAGKSISSANMQQIQSAYEVLGKLIELGTKTTESSEGDDEDMKKEDVQEIIKAAVAEGLKPVNEKLGILEKGEETPQANEDVTKADEISAIVKQAINESLQSVNDRLSKIEKAKGVSKQLEDQPEDPVKKSANSWAGLDI
jgi:hypothetical protein